MSRRPFTLRSAVNLAAKSLVAVGGAVFILKGLLLLLNLLGLFQTGMDVLANRNMIVKWVFTISQAWPLGVFVLGVFVLACIRWGSPKAWIAALWTRPPEQHEVYDALDQLKTLFGKGTAMETAFQIPEKANPTSWEIQDWIVSVNKCARQKALAGIVGPKEIKKFNTAWHVKDVRRVESLLEEFGHFDGVDDVGRLAFRTIWGHAKRLEELIATIEGTQVIPKYEVEQHEKFRKSERNISDIERRATEAETGININLAALGIMDALRVDPTKEMMGVVKGGPTPLEPIDEQLINDAYEIDRELTWQAYRDLGIAVTDLNRGIAKHNEEPALPFCHELLRRVEIIRKLGVVIARERLERETSD